MFKHSHPDLRALLFGAVFAGVAGLGYEVVTSFAGPDWLRRAAMGFGLGMLATPALVLPGRRVDRMIAMGWALRFGITIALVVLLASSDTRFVASSGLALPTLVVLGLTALVSGFGLWPRFADDPAQAAWFHRWYLAHRSVGWQRNLIVLGMPLIFAGFLVMILRLAEIDLYMVVFVGAVTGLSPMQIRNRHTGQMGLGALMTLTAALILALATLF